MDMFDPQITISLGVLIAGSGLILTWQKIVKNAKKSKEEEAARIIQRIKEEDQNLKNKLEARIEKLDAQIKNLELNVNKDLSFVKESYKAELKTLGEKIEILRSELSSQYGSLVSLLSKLIDKK